MILSFKRSDSLGYKITKWFRELQKIHIDFINFYNELFELCTKKIHPIIIDLLRNYGKESKAVLNVKYNEIILHMSNNAINFFELNELLLNYNQYLTLIKEYEFKYESINKFESIILNEINEIQTIKIIIRDIIKAGALVFKKRKSSRKHDEDFIFHLKKYNRFISNLIKESPIRDKKIEDALNELTDDVKKTQQEELDKEKQQSDS